MRKILSEACIKLQGRRVILKPTSSYKEEILIKLQGRKPASSYRGEECGWSLHQVTGEKSLGEACIKLQGRRVWVKPTSSYRGEEFGWSLHQVTGEKSLGEACIKLQGRRVWVKPASSYRGEEFRWGLHQVTGEKSLGEAYIKLQRRNPNQVTRKKAFIKLQGRNPNQVTRKKAYIKLQERRGWVYCFLFGFCAEIISVKVQQFWVIMFLYTSWFVRAQRIGSATTTKTVRTRKRWDKPPRWARFLVFQFCYLQMWHCSPMVRTKLGLWPSTSSVVFLTCLWCWVTRPCLLGSCTPR